MNLPIDLVMERIAYLQPENHLLPETQWLLGFKLLPETFDRLSPDYLYLTDRPLPVPSGCTVPIFIMDPERRWTRLPQNCISSHSNLPLPDVFNELLGLQTLLQTWDLELNLSVSQNRGIQHLLDLSEPVLGCPIVVLDPAFKSLAGSTSFDTDDQVFSELLELGYLRQESFNRLRDNDYFTPDHYTGETLILPPSNIKKYTSTFTAVLDENGTVRYEVLMLCSDVPFSNGLYQLYLYLLDKILHYLRSTITPESTVAKYEFFVLDILDGHCTSPEEIRERGSYFLEYHSPEYNAVVIQLQNSTEMYRKYAMFTLQNQFPEYQFIHYRDSILFFVDLGDWKQDFTPSAPPVVLKLNNYLQQASAYAGISIRFRSITDLRDAYAQAREALQLGLKLDAAANRSPYDHIFWYSDYYVYCMLDAARQVIPERELIHHLYRTLAKEDQENHTEYLSLLLTFLRNERNYTNTGKELHMHRNNVIYHIQRLEERYSFSLDDPELRFQLLISEYAHKMIPGWTPEDRG